MKNTALSLNVKNNKNNVLMNGQYGSTDFQVGLNERNEVIIGMDGNEITTEDIVSTKSSICSEPKYIKPYLREVWYNVVDYAYAKNYFKDSNNSNNISGGRCSAIRNGRFYGRSFDWIYSDVVELIVHTPRIGSRYASYGTTGAITDLTIHNIDTYGLTGQQKMMAPFTIVDGKNEWGVIVNNNVVPVMNGKPNYRTVPDIEERDEICAIMVPRYVLDNFKTAKEAVEYIRDYVAIYPHEMLLKSDYEQHYIISDKKSTYLLEIIDNKVVIIDMTTGSNSTLAGKPYMTNFHLAGVIVNSDGSVYTPETKTASKNAMETNKIEPHGSGLERYNIIAADYSTANTKAGMRALLDKLTYTKAYDPSEKWYTEFVGGSGENDYNVATDVEKYVPLVEHYADVFAHRSRNPKDPTYGTWHSAHSCIYDFESNKFWIISQEDGEELEFEFTFDKPTEIPDCPTDEDGKYKLECTVTNGVPVYEWVKEN